MASTFGVYSDAYTLAEAIARLCEDPHPEHDSWRARCPNHQGKSDTSLSLTPTDDRVLLKCFGGCDTATIVHGIGLTMADLFIKNAVSVNRQKRLVKEYDYYDASGTLIHQTVRYEPKAFRQRRPDPAQTGEWIWNLKTIQTVLYNLPAVLKAIQVGENIYLCEGEKDADALISRGLVATTCPMGAGKWRKHYNATFSNANVVLLPHNDTPGQQHVRKIATALDGIAATIKVVLGMYTEASGSDISDWLQAGGTRETFDLCIATTPLYEFSRQPPLSPTPTAGTEPRLPYSDYTNAQALIREHGQSLHYIYPWKSWLVWNGAHWERDTSGTVMRYAKSTIKRLAGTIADLDDDDQAKALLKHIKASLSTTKLKAMVESAQSEIPIPAQPEHCDIDPWLLNCSNGTLNLRTGIISPHQQSDMITKCLTIAYDACATCPLWLQFLWRIMGGSPPDHPDLSMGELEARHTADTRAHDLIGFLQRAIGYSLTGSTREQCIFILHGPTKTGKSTFLATLRALFGPYGQQADMASFMHKERDEVRNDLADLAASRFVCALESQEGKRFAESLIKQLTGGTDLIKARFLFQEYFTFKPQFKIFLGTNHKPVIKETDSAIWERIRLVPFVVPIPLLEREKTLDERLQAELPGILIWAVQGCLEWQRRGNLGEPDAVVQATTAYREESDTLGRFLRECCATNPGQAQPECNATLLYETYQAWCRHNGEPEETQTKFGRYLTEQHITTSTRSKKTVRLGIGLIPRNANS